MAGELCSPNCGHCGRCTAEPEHATYEFSCALCGLPCLDDEFYPYCGPVCHQEAEPDPCCCWWCGDPMPADTTYQPYCSSLCAAQVERDSEEDYQ